MMPTHLAQLGLALILTHSAWASSLAEFKLIGDWEVEVTLSEPSFLRATVQVAPPAPVIVSAEPYDALPEFNPEAAGWIKGRQLRGVQAQECTTPGLLDPNSFQLRAGPEPTTPVFEHGKDYDLDAVWGTFGRTTNGLIEPDQTVFASYRHAQSRIDAVVLTPDGRILVRQGQGLSAAPLPPKIREGERHLGNIWLPGRITRLQPEHLFPVVEAAYPEPPKTGLTPAERLLPKTLKKLRSGERLRLLAWGDSVTVGTYLPDWEHQRWQEQFVRRLRQQFPMADIELVTEAWGGRNTGSYLGEPPGSPHNYREKVLGAKPDLVVSEFVNDAGLDPSQVEARYANLLADFQSIGAEWIILTPHYVRPDWMGLTHERDIDEDPRPYVAGLRQFAGGHPVALADAARRYGRLWRQGIPYSTLMLNSINHPDARGMSIFVAALMELFP
ncbi:MAG: GDSL-type esterase/lipase family protein [Verrucomicrobiia bacterium]